MKKNFIAFFMAWMCFSNMFAADLVGGETLYLKLNTQWQSMYTSGELSWHALCVKNGATVEFVKMEEQIYPYFKAIVPDGTWPEAFFCRMRDNSKNTPENELRLNVTFKTQSYGFYNFEDRDSGDCYDAIAFNSYNEGTNCLTINEGVWKGYAYERGSWSTYTPPALFPKGTTLFFDATKWNPIGDGVRIGICFNQDDGTAVKMDKITNDFYSITIPEGTWAVKFLRFRNSNTIEYWNVLGDFLYEDAGIGNNLFTANGFDVAGVWSHYNLPEVSFSVTVPKETEDCYVKIEGQTDYISLIRDTNNNNRFNLESTVSLPESATYNYYTSTIFDSKPVYLKEVDSEGNPRNPRELNTGEDDIVESWEDIPTITVYFKVPENWKVVRLHAWVKGNPDVDIFLEGWPGRIIQNMDDGWYYYTFINYEEINFIITGDDFSNNFVRINGEINGITKDVWIIVDENSNATNKTTEYSDPATFTWIGTNTTWNSSENWKIGETEANRSPGKNKDDIVIIPENGNIYPIVPLTGPEVKVNIITFKPEAEIGNQHKLIHNGATVEFKLSNTGRLHMLSLPMTAELADFQFKEKDPAGPLAFLLKFTPKKDAENNTVANWDFINKGNNQGLAIGEGFIAATLDKDWSGWIDNHYIASISGQLATGDIPVNVEFALDGPKDEAPSYFALAGNPYMASIDFNELALANSDIIKSGYLVWTVVGEEEGFIGYNALGDFGMAVTGNDAPSQYIAPLQAFFVERKDDFSNETVTLSFPLSITENASGKGTLRSATSDNYGKLDIVAENGTVPVKTFITNKEGAEPARKLKNGCGSIPDVYTLGDDNATAFGANIINTDNAISVPLGIATKTKEDTRLTFSGMSSFSDVNITLIDNATDATIPLTGDSFPYDFMYIPPTNDKGAVIADESRFVIAFSPKNATGLDAMLKESLSVYSKNNVVHIVSSSADPIRQINVYDMQGRMLFAESNLNTSVFSVNGLQSSAADIYIVKIITEKGVKNVKVINK